MKIFVVVFLLLTLALLLLRLVKQLKALFAAQRKKVLIYLLSSILLAGFIGLFTNERVFGFLMTNFIAVEILFLLSGILHLYLQEIILAWEEDKKNTVQFLFTVVTSMFGSIGFLLVANFFGAPTFQYFFWLSMLSFFIPFFFRFLWINTLNFPNPVYMKWYYPLTRNVTSPDAEELRNPRIVSLFFEKDSASEKISIFKAKAPEFMSFGKFFFHFINDYNSRNPESPIDFKNFNNQPYGWIFYTKPNFFGYSRTINPEHTVLANGIKDYGRIVCQRIRE